MNVEKTIICKECGNECVRTSNSQRVCPECRKKIRYQGYSKALPASNKKPHKKHKTLSISDICKLAKAEGLTYGQYVSKYGS